MFAIVLFDPARESRTTTRRLSGAGEKMPAYLGRISPVTDSWKLSQDVQRSEKVCVLCVAIVAKQQPGRARQKR